MTTTKNTYNKSKSNFINPTEKEIKKQELIETLARLIKKYAEGK